ncbi:MAG: fused MFS/spermidine synthase [Flavobacteriales bacterium]|nr:fused MFS/spermidine synthase [Flavobacteriales bacterium]
MQLQRAFIISFIEGGVLMAYEIIASKLYTPLIGGSIYVWTSILSITLFGLALGYKKGDDESKGVSRLFFALIVAGLYILAIPYIYKFMLTPFLGFDIRILSLLTGLLILFVPMYLLGQVSPILIRLISTEHHTKIGYNTGRIYFVGTLGGVFLSLLFIFLLLDSFGVKNLLLFLASLLIIAGLISKFKQDNEKL